MNLKKKNNFPKNLLKKWQKWCTIQNGIISTLWMTET